MEYTLQYTPQALDDWETLRRLGEPGLVARARRLLELLSKDPFIETPPYKALTGKLAGVYARRLSARYRLLYQVIDEEKAVKVLTLLTHYSD